MTDADAPEPRSLELSDFAPHRGTVFELTGEGVPGAPLPLTLTEARTLVAGDGIANRDQPFGLLFRGPAEPLLPQRIYRLAHPEVGTHDIFLVPIGRKPEGVEYEAIFT
jgi:hypothetical protein